MSTFQDKRFFFYGNRTPLVEKLTRILNRIDAKVVDAFCPDIDMIITVDTAHNIGLKRRHGSELENTAKRVKLSDRVQRFVNRCSNELVNESNVSDTFLDKMRKSGFKIKSIDELWTFLNENFKLVVQCYDDEDLSEISPSMVQNFHVKRIKEAGFKVIDTFTGFRPIVAEKVPFHTNLWMEAIQMDNEVTQTISKRGSRGSIRKDDKPKYCECCKVNYSDLNEHLLSSRHQEFANNPNSFVDFGKLLSDPSEIDSFFRARLNRLRLKSIRLRNVPNHVNVKSSFASENIKEILSSSDSSIFSSSSDSSDSTSSKISLNICASTPLRPLAKFDLFSPDSCSNDDLQQSQLTQHVSGVLSNLTKSLNLSDVVHVKDREYSDSSISFDESYASLRLPNKSAQSIVLCQRFKWCKTCFRNHIPVQYENYVCNLTHVSNMKMQPVDIDDTDNRFLSHPSSIARTSITEIATQTELEIISLSNYIDSDDNDIELSSLNKVDMVKEDSSENASNPNIVRENSSVKNFRRSNISKSMDDITLISQNKNYDNEYSVLHCMKPLIKSSSNTTLKFSSMSNNHEDDDYKENINPCWFSQDLVNDKTFSNGTIEPNTKIRKASSTNSEFSIKDVLEEDKDSISCAEIRNLRISTNISDEEDELLTSSIFVNSNNENFNGEELKENETITESNVEKSEINNQKLILITKSTQTSPNSSPVLLKQNKKVKKRSCETSLSNSLTSRRSTSRRLLDSLKVNINDSINCNYSCANRGRREAAKSAFIGIRNTNRILDCNQKEYQQVLRSVNRNLSIRNTDLLKGLNFSSTD